MPDPNEMKAKKAWATVAKNLPEYERQLKEEKEAAKKKKPKEGALKRLIRRLFKKRKADKASVPDFTRTKGIEREITDMNALSREDIDRLRRKKK